MFNSSMGGGGLQGAEVSTIERNMPATTLQLFLDSGKMLISNIRNRYFWQYPIQISHLPLNSKAPNPT